MLYIYTLFDRNKGMRPLISGVIDTDRKIAKFLPFYLPGSGLSLYDIEQNIKELCGLIANADNLMINNYLQHLTSVRGISYRKDDTVVYDIQVGQAPYTDDISDLKLRINTILKGLLKIKPMKWHAIHADASEAYHYLQAKGVLLGYSKVYPMYNSTYTGRSSTSGFNIQGAKEGDCISNVSGGEIFINFDWIAADARAAALLSGDNDLIQSYVDSDPYQYLCDIVNDGVSDRDRLVTRDESKNELLRSLYKMDINSPALQIYSRLGEWVAETREFIRDNGYATSILGRKFTMRTDSSKDRTERSVFNAVLQGTVAHAMQIVVNNVWRKYPDELLTETHDSITITSSKDINRISSYIREISRVMIRPFHGIIDNDIEFPIKVSVGREYKKWKFYKRFNTYEEIE